MPERFGFTVRHERDYYTKEFQGWTVSLPHQCDNWDIAGEKHTNGLSRDEAVAELERFLAEGAEALAALREEREIDEE